MRSRPIDLLRAALLLASIGAGAACGIGPKQDDPASIGPGMSDASLIDSGTELTADTGGLSAMPDGTADNTETGGATDAVAPPPAETGCDDAGDAGCSDASSDVATDAPEGG